MNLTDWLIILGFLSSSFYQIYLVRTKQSLIQTSKKGRLFGFLIALVYIGIFYLAFFTLEWYWGILLILIGFIIGLFVATILSRFISLKILKIIAFIGMLTFVSLTLVQLFL